MCDQSDNVSVPVGSPLSQSPRLGLDCLGPGASEAVTSVRSPGGALSLSLWASESASGE